MIQCKCNLVGKLSAKENLTGKLNNAIVKEYPELEDLEVTPSSSEQSFKSSKYGYDNVKVKAIETTELNIMPSTENQVKEGTFSKVTVAGDSNLLSENIKKDVTIFNVTGTAEVKGEENAIIDSSKLIKNTVSGSVSYVLNRMITKLPKDINTSEWTTMSYMFYNCINLKNLDLSNFDTSNVINMNAMFSECNNLVSLDLSNFDTSKVTDMSYMFSKCSMLTSLDVSNFNISKAININNMFENCKSLVSLDLSSFDLSSYSNNLNNLFFGCSKLENLKSFKNLGKGYTKKSNNYYSLGLNYSNLLTHESLMDVINNLYDLNLTYNVANGGTLYRQILSLGSTNLAKLTAEEIAIATNKGWNVT